jgi:hypothetical protein
MNKIEELEAKLEERRLARAKAEEAQYEKDLEARIELEGVHGTIAAVKVSRFVHGIPTRAYVRMPTASEYKRYKDLIFRAAADKGAKTSAQRAQEDLARSCWVYPSGEEQAAMLEAIPGLLTPISMASLALAEGKNEETGKD